MSTVKYKRFFKLILICINVVITYSERRKILRSFDVPPIQNFIIKKSFRIYDPSPSPPTPSLCLINREGTFLNLKP